MVIFSWISTSPGDESWNYGTQNIPRFFFFLNEVMARYGPKYSFFVSQWNKPVYGMITPFITIL